MKKFFVLFSFCCLGFVGSLCAQGLDGLFDDTDFSGKIDAAPQKTSSAPAAVPAPAPVSAGTPAAVAPPVSASFPPPAAMNAPRPSAAPVPPQPSSAPVAAQATAPASGTSQAPQSPSLMMHGGFGMPQTTPSALSLPYTGAVAPSNKAGLLSRMGGDAPDLPMLGMGGGSKKSGDEEQLSLFERRKRELGDYESHAADFDIAGMMLGMTPAEIMEAAAANGFSVKFRNRKIPSFLRWKYKKLCLKETSFSYAALQQCIKEAAEGEEQEYVSRLQFVKPELKEKINVEFTSGFGGNKAYRIRYENKADHSLGATAEGQYHKNKRRRDFMYAVLQKYGQPDDEDAMLWGMKDEGAYLEAAISPAFLDVTLTLENMDLTDTDSDNMFLADKKEALEIKFSF